MNFEFEKILDLIQRTGDRVIVFDKFEPSKSYVMMNIDEYERLIEEDCHHESWEDYCCLFYFYP